MARITGLELPIPWDGFGWPSEPLLNGITLTTGDPKWTWDPTPPRLAVPARPHHEGVFVDRWVIDHVVLLVPSLESAIGTLAEAGLVPRLRMQVRERPAAFFRAGPVLEVIEAPVRNDALYGIAVATTEALDAVALNWRARGLAVGEVKRAIQPGRRIFTVHDLDAGFAVMSADRQVQPADLG
ncbi:MAG: hypothetical protein R2823_01095 [Acidimicrobiia bacterium]